MLVAYSLLVHCDCLCKQNLWPIIVIGLSKHIINNIRKFSTSICFASSPHENCDCYLTKLDKGWLILIYSCPLGHFLLQLFNTVSPQQNVLGIKEIVIFIFCSSRDNQMTTIDRCVFMCGKSFFYFLSVIPMKSFLRWNRWKYYIVYIWTGCLSDKLFNFTLFVYSYLQMLVYA